MQLATAAWRNSPVAKITRTWVSILEINFRVVSSRNINELNEPMRR